MSNGRSQSGELSNGEINARLADLMENVKMIREEQQKVYERLRADQAAHWERYVLQEKAIVANEKGIMSNVRAIKILCWMIGILATFNLATLAWLLDTAGGKR